MLNVTQGTVSCSWPYLGYIKYIHFEDLEMDSYNKFQLYSFKVVRYSDM